MGNCVLRDCGFDVDRKNDDKALENFQENVFLWLIFKLIVTYQRLKKNKPLPRVSADGNTDEEEESELSDESEEEESPKKKKKNKPKENPVTVQIYSSEGNLESED